MMLGLDFIPPEKFSNMSLNALRRRVVNHDKNLIRLQMDEPLFELDPRDHVSYSGTPLSPFHFLENNS
jgi:hypothetical protein